VTVAHEPERAIAEPIDREPQPEPSPEPAPEHTGPAPAAPAPPIDRSGAGSSAGVAIEPVAEDHSGEGASGSAEGASGSGDTLESDRSGHDGGGGSGH
jgi:hypothetical protein